MQKSDAPNFAPSNGHTDIRNSANYFSDLPVRIGILGGLLGSFAIIAVITTLALGAGFDIFLSPRAIASVILREGALTGVFPVILGTIMHLIAGGIYGALFAAVLPKMPRAFWFVAGLLFGMATWFIAVVVLPFVMPDLEALSSTAYFSGLIVAHATYGIVLGITGSFYGYRQAKKATT